ncbi:hypothetical protein KJS94_12100 [Flavihumibacter rivuli]|uniref:hypothetical protein n=1 Tax=Flavihumibacter rivuli TaxID=2838156 RepID=UPI001BDED316|nr:hypothetical protein [Flavihumibacter rivuli]ULQ55384.1 hypothetical protein KJS94_12100 [Flavihumibacter rivuli]
MHLSEKIKKAVEQHPMVIAALKTKGRDNWKVFTRTQFNLVARVINREISREVLANPDLVEMNLLIGKQKLEKEMYRLRCHSIFDFLKWLANVSEFRGFSWVSGKTLQSYWNAGEAKDIKVNALLVFLKVPFKDWDLWLKDTGRTSDRYTSAMEKLPSTGTGFSKSSLQIVKSYYLGNYFLYYQKTDGSKNIIKTPFILKEHESGQVIVKSVSEGHRYSGKVIGIRDGCLYINCQNLDFEEMEQYVFNIGLETKPQVLFGVSTTVSVKTRQAVALKNILVKQKTLDPAFDNIQETEIPFSKKYNSDTEEAIIVNYLKQSEANILTAPSCCNLEDLL